MFVSAHSDIQPFQLNHALLLYGDATGTSYVSIHAISHDVGGGPPTMLAGRPATKEAVTMLCRKLVPGAQSRPCWLPSRCLSVGDGYLMWWTEPGTRRMYVSCKELGEREAWVPHPPLLWVVERRRWRVFALATNERPTPNTPLCHAPFFNIYDDGRICSGSAGQPKSTAPDSIEAWEAAFFCSSFTHPNGIMARCTHPRGLYALWQALLDGEHTVFPDSLLQPCQGTVASLLASIQTGEAND